MWFGLPLKLFAGFIVPQLASIPKFLCIVPLSFVTYPTFCGCRKLISILLDLSDHRSIYRHQMVFFTAQAIWHFMHLIWINKEQNTSK